jgi:FKBP-type peptidyl-prolyl cis-trans isomerase SlyD
MIENNLVVSMNYTLKDEQGNVLDSSSNGPLEYLHGHQNIIPGLEKALAGLAIGDKKQVTVQPEDGYGPYQKELQFGVPVSQFQGNAPEAGTMMQITSQNGEVIVATVQGMDNDFVVMDANHPLAGKVLNFDVEITGTRPASAEELSHGHPHGPGGHHH